MNVPIRRNQFDVAGFAAWLAENGAFIKPATNPYELIRYLAYWQGSTRAVTHIVYTKDNGLLTYMGGAKAHYEAFLHGDPLPDTLLETQEKRSRRVKNTAAVREKLRQRDGDCCWFCGDLLSSSESNIEHLINISDGGTNALSNLVLVHTRCNTAAGNLPLHRKLELRAKLRAASVDGRRMAETPKSGSVRSTTSAVPKADAHD